MVFSSAYALSFAETSPRRGHISAAYQPGGVGEQDRYGWHLSLDFGATEIMGAGLTLSRLYGPKLHTTFGDIHFKYQFFEASERTPALAGLVGYRWVSEAGETLSGLQVAFVGDLQFSERLTGHGRLGASFFEHNTLVDVDFGLGLELVPSLSLDFSFKAFSVDSTTEGGFALGLTYHFGPSFVPEEEEEWW
ncbi:MAG TPA: hypothetical protein EYP85_12525 [Armatimonadetes bacterium]|nr:hypothetical protein [Armatimonadota bacterium]